MNRPFRRTYVLSILVLLILFSLTYWYVFRGYPLPALKAAVDLANNWLLVLSLLCSSGYIWGEAACIHALLRPLGQTVSYHECLAYSAIGVCFAAITPSSSGGQPAQIYYMNKRGIPVTQSTVVMLVVAVIYKAVLLLVGLPLVFIDAPIVFTDVPYFRILFYLGIAVNLTLISGGLLLMFSRKLVFSLASFFLDLLERLHFRKRSEKAKERLTRHLTEYHAAADYLRSHKKVVLRVTIYTTLQRLAVFTTAYCVYRAFGLSALSWPDILAIQTAISLAVDSLPLPGAVGASEGVFLGLYAGIYGKLLLVPALVLTRGANYYLPALLTGMFTIFIVARNALASRRKESRI